MVPLLDIAARLAGVLFGALLVTLSLASAIRTFVLPRSSQDLLSRTVFLWMRRVFDARLRWVRGYPQRDRIMAFYAPLSLMMLLPAWYFLVMIGYALIFRAVGVESWYLAFRTSMSSVTTLGFEPAEGALFTIIAFTEAVIGLMLVALLLAYLPTMYAAFSRRENMVTLLEVRAGDPPSAVEMIRRYHHIHGLEELRVSWQRWEEWFADLEESHTSLSPLVFFRSPQLNHSWLTASGTVMDAAALMLSAVDAPGDPQAALCIRAGYLALRRIADYFRLDYDIQVEPSERISIERDEFEKILNELATAGVPLKADREQAWQDFFGWRKNYDRVLLALAQLTMAPPSPWSSDRDPV